MRELAEKILDLVRESHKHRMADYLNDGTTEMVIDAILVALVVKNDIDLDKINIEFNKQTIKFTEESHFKNFK